MSKPFYASPRPASVVRATRVAPVYRVMTRNHSAEADECIGRYTSPTEAAAKAQNASTLGNTAWVVNE